LIANYNALKWQGIKGITVPELNDEVKNHEELTLFLQSQAAGALMLLARHHNSILQLLLSCCSYNVSQMLHLPGCAIFGGSVVNSQCWWLSCEQKSYSLIRKTKARVW
jgi:hypothetical protein